ncbi:MAG: DegT/DnrJ/EryC1/StrS aminotransferase family protein [Ilumatobacter sp.]|nr:DegT/DnrJ/EryC1/StrS aminotransferase family protein [Ilumatobacter sp.]
MAGIRFAWRLLLENLRPSLSTSRTAFLAFSPPSIGEGEIASVTKSLGSDWITTGPKTHEFEVAFAERVTSPAALAVSSCTDALQVALAALGIGPGDAVFTTTMTFCSTVHVIEHVSATPILVDIDPETLNLSPIALQQAIDAVTEAGELTPRCIMPVHYAGHPCDMAAIDEIAAAHGLAIVEDAAHALPAIVDGRTIGDPSGPDGLIRATAFSFYATKNLTTAEGGMLTGPADLIEEARLWSLHGMSRDAWKRYGKGGSWYYEVIRPGFKCNMTDLQSSLGLVQLDRLSGFQTHRDQILATYRDGFSDLAALELHPERPNVTSAHHLYPVRLHHGHLSIDRARFIDELAERNIGASVHFIPIHIHPYYADKYGYSASDFPVAHREYERLLSLPLNNKMTLDDAADVVTAVRDICDTFALARD